VIEIKDVDSGHFICRLPGHVEGCTSHVAHGPVFELAQLQCCPNLNGAQPQMSGLALLQVAQLLPRTFYYPNNPFKSCDI